MIQWRLLLPGLLMAMTGVGVGDLATAGFTGAQLGVVVLWAILVGALFKIVLTEGIARWQLATQQSVIEGAIQHFRWPFMLFMALYFLPWCWFVGGALINATGVAATQFLLQFDIHTNKIFMGVLHSLLALGLLWLGSTRWFNGAMGLLAAILFITVLSCAALIPFNVSDVLYGLFIPSIPEHKDAISWTFALMGGVGGTLTILCYGYWLKNDDRSGLEGLKRSRLDIGVSYFMTALFGIAMVIIGAAASQQGKGLGLLLSISDYFDQHIANGVGGVFLLGAWAAIFSSMLGVWQAVPLMFADAFYGLKHQTSTNLEKSQAYRFWMCVLAIVPMASLMFSFKEMQKLYSLVGAWFMPILALTLLYLNNRKVSTEFKNPWPVNGALAVVFVFFAWMAL